MKVDLHMHSTASDGQYRPEELVRLAKNAGLDAMALTDHDTLSGLKEACETGQACGLCVIPGVELSAMEYHNLHILGYGFSPDSEELQELCAFVLSGRERHTSYTIKFLRNKGIYIDLEEVIALAGRAAVGRPHFARVMVEHGYVQNSREAFDRYLDTEEYHRVDRKKPPVQTCIETIRKAGGFAVLAHPYQLHLEPEALEEQVRLFQAYGLSGIECHYPKHTPEQQSYYLGLAQKYQLHVTAGSDFHGEQVHKEDKIIPVEMDLAWLLRRKKEGSAE